MAVFDLSTVTFTESANTVVESYEILIPYGSVVNTLGGADTVKSDYETANIDDGSFDGSVFGIYNQDTLEMAGSADKLEGYVSYTGTDVPTWVYGITNGFDGYTTTISTGASGDQVKGIAFAGDTPSGYPVFTFGITNFFNSTIDTGSSADLVYGYGESIDGIYAAGIWNKSDDIEEDSESLKTLGSGGSKGTGSLDNLSPQGTSDLVKPDCIQDYSLITTGDGSDQVIGESVGDLGENYGIYNTGVIDTGSNGDTVKGTATNEYFEGFAGGIVQFDDGEISTGDGADQVIGTASAEIYAVGIYGGSIYTGAGSDQVTASATVGGELVDGFGGGVNVDLGSGSDFLKGFGDGFFVGGSGFDTLDLTQYSVYDFDINVTDASTNTVEFSMGDTTMFTTQFEYFKFSDLTAYTVANLPQSVV
jgi:hypothetical protein